MLYQRAQFRFMSCNIKVLYKRKQLYNFTCTKLSYLKKYPYRKTPSYYRLLNLETRRKLYLFKKNRY